MKYFFLIVIAVLNLSFMPHCNNAGVKKIWLFSKEKFAGRIKIDDDGNKSKGHTYHHFLILELKKDNVISWDSLIYQNKTYQINTSVIKKPEFIAGKINDDKNIIIKPKANRYLVEIQILNLDVLFDNNVDYEFNLMGTKDGKLINHYFTNKNVNLMPDFYQ